MYTTVRSKSASTFDHLRTALSLLESDSTSQVIFFASPERETADLHPNDGTSSNFPLVCLLAKVDLPGVHPVYVLCDGLFLTAARRPRYSEVQDLLDAACSSGKAFFSTVRAPFTSRQRPDEATQTLLEVAQLEPLTAASRAQYFGLLSEISEEQYP